MIFFIGSQLDSIRGNSSIHGLVEINDGSLKTRTVLEMNLILYYFIPHISFSLYNPLANNERQRNHTRSIFTLILIASFNLCLTHCTKTHNEK